jgi:hypothetical protein
MVHDGETGFLAQPGRPHVFADKVVTALASAEDVGRRAAEAFSGRYTMEAVARDWQATLQRAIAR